MDARKEALIGFDSDLDYTRYRKPSMKKKGRNSKGGFDSDWERSETQAWQQEQEEELQTRVQSWQDNSPSGRRTSSLDTGKGSIRRENRDMSEFLDWLVRENLVNLAPPTRFVPLVDLMRLL
jgi:hypothetical protein